MIQINNISKVYEQNTVLSIPELTITKGECLGLVGNNGAGKTTLFNALLDLIKPTTGTISNKNIEVHKSEDWKQFTGSFIDETFLIEYLTLTMYVVEFKFIKNLLYLDGALKKGTKNIETSDLSWLDQFGDIAPFIKNDIKLIWRNKRPRSVLITSGVLLGYGLIMFNSSTYGDSPILYIFVFLFMTGAFLINFGQFIPAWDASFYKMLMSQNIKYEQYLNSKRYLMTIATTILFFLAIPYIYFGIENLYYLIAAYLYNIGVNTFALLFIGGFNKKKIELGKAAAFNYQGTGLAQWLAGIPTFGLPAIIVSLGILFGNLYLSLGFLGGLGIIGLLFQKFWMKKIAELYIKRKYTTIKAFSN